MPKFRFQVGEGGTKLSVVIEERKFEASSVAEFKEELDRIWNDRLRSVEFDFSAVQFIDSSGIGALLGIRKRMDPESGPMVILDPQPTVVSIIKLLHLQRVFTLRHS